MLINTGHTKASPTKDHRSGYHIFHQQWLRPNIERFQVFAAQEGMQIPRKVWLRIQCCLGKIHVWYRVTLVAKNL